MEIVAAVYIVLEICLKRIFKQIERRANRTFLVIKEAISALLTYLLISYCAMLIIIEEGYSFFPALSFLQALSMWPTYIVLLINLIAVTLLCFGEIKRNRKLNSKYFYVTSAILATISLLISFTAR